LELCEAASKGPWKVKTNRHRNTDGTSWGWVEGTREGWCWSKNRNHSYEDAVFIAMAREAIPWYIAEIRRLRAEVEQYREALEWIAQQPCANKSNVKKYTACTESDDCITEYCLPCYAKKALEAGK